MLLLLCFDSGSIPKRNYIWMFFVFNDSSQTHHFCYWYIYLGCSSQEKWVSQTTLWVAEIHLMILSFTSTDSRLWIDNFYQRKNEIKYYGCIAVHNFTWWKNMCVLDFHFPKALLCSISYHKNKCFCENNSLLTS